MTKNYKLKIAYDGTRYSGWERQPGKDTIQGKLETVFTRMIGAPKEAAGHEDQGGVEIIGAGRTDAGVHARGAVANMHIDTDFSEEEIRDYANHYLPDDIAVISVKEASDRFHARYNAKGRSYVYTIFDGPVKPIFNRKYYTRLELGKDSDTGKYKELDVDAMNEGARYLIGEHDFKSFCGNPHMKKSTVRTVDVCEVRRSKGYVYLNIHGTGFLQHMVRIIAGTLMEVGLHRMEPAQVGEILEAKDRKVAGPTAPAEGLTFMSVDY